jgi:hypothetical protein
MNTRHLSRVQKEALYISKSTELQRHWGNPISAEDFDDVGELTGKQLEQLTTDAVGQLQFEKWWFRSIAFVNFVVKTFMILGIIGLLLFGLRQLF